VTLGVIVLIAALAVASYEMFRRRGTSARERGLLDASDPPPHLLNDADADGGDADGGAGGD